MDALEHDAMKVALRVLSRLTEKRPADPEDIMALRDLAPEASDYEPDELACDVIRRALHDRASRLRIAVAQRGVAPRTECAPICAR